MGSFRDEFKKLGRAALGSLGASLQKAAGNLPDDKQTTTNSPVPTEKSNEDPKSLFWDPFSIVEQLGYKDKPSSITYGTLKAITYRMPVIQAIIQTRINQVASFCVPQRDKYQMGFKIKLRDSEKEPTKVERNYMKDMERFIVRTGVSDNPQGRDSFEHFSRKLIYDSLTYDQFAYEIVPNRKGQPSEIYAVDASTIRLADTASSEFNEDDTKAIRFVQVYDSMIINQYNQNEMCFGIRNPRTDIRLQGYGVSELEMLISTITNLLYAWEANQKQFTQGSLTKGILNFKGTIPEKRLQDFRKQWYQQVSSIENAWKAPITNADELQYINLQQSAKDMEFTAWMDFQIKVACALYSMDPVELNFKYGNVGQKTGLHEGSNKEKLTESKERGLRPLLRFYARTLNQNVIWRINENFILDFVGLDASTHEETIETNIKRVKSTMTVDEIRAEDDLPPLPDGKGEVILDPTWLQYAMSKEGGGMQGGFGEGGGGFGEDQDNEGGEENNEDNTDYERLLRQYENEEEEESEEEEKSDSERAKEAKKSLTKSWVMNI